MHPRFIATIYTGTYSDYLWRRYHVRKKELDTVMAFASKCFALCAWGIGYELRHLSWNKAQNVCKWDQRINFYQAIQW
jgi:hypothetical protein